MLDANRERRLLDLAQARGLEQLGEVTFARAREAATRPARRVELARRVPERAERAAAAGVIPDASRPRRRRLRVTRAISRSPATGSAMKWTTSCASATSNASSSKGSSSAAARCTSPRGAARARPRRTAPTGRPPTRLPVPGAAPARPSARPARSRRRAPAGPRLTAAKSASAGASGTEYLPMKRSYASAPVKKLTCGIYALMLGRRRGR